MACRCIKCGRPCDCEELYCIHCLVDISDREIEEMEELNKREVSNG